MKVWKTILAASVLALASSTAALAARTDLVLGIPLEPPHLDPTAGAAAAIDEVLYANVFEGLTRVGSKGEVLPALAESWTISEDGLTYRFALHEGVTFHDGTSFDAEDVKFTFDRLLAEDSVNAQKALYAPISTVTAVDPATVEFTLSRPDGLFLFNMGRGDAVIEPGLGVRVYVDPKSMLLVKDTQIDFETGLRGHGFRFKNPNVHGSCGCGESVNF